MSKLKKILLLGSGALKIGQAGEFDYSGSQAIKALREEGIEVVLLNPNIATVQTDQGLAQKIYFLPVNFYFAKKVIQKERPQGVLLGFGGQTALNCGLELEQKGVLKKYNVQVLGTSIKTIRETEDRKLFVKKLNQIKVKTAKSQAAINLTQAMRAARIIGYPVIIRAAFSLGGQNSGLAKDEKELRSLAQKAFTSLPQILIEEYLHHWKEIEYEVVRDRYDNVATVCNMENVDPMGIHTGESIVVAPSQTLNNHEYHKLREISIRSVRHLGIIGESNIQFALDPGSNDYRVIEMNARLSRSSALASKATGYPLAFVAAKLALGFSLADIENSITKSTKAFFEPALDYLVVKMPRWDLEKFAHIERQIGSQMKSVGEVMAIGRGFEEALQKATRMLDIGKPGLLTNYQIPKAELIREISQPSDQRIFAIAEALKKGMNLKKIYQLSGIDPWFLDKIQNITKIETRLKKQRLSKELLSSAKKNGFSDEQIAQIKKTKASKIRSLRKKWHVTPFVKQIDTLAAEFPAKTNYLYLTYHGASHDLRREKKAIALLGSGVYRIGSSVEFDWCCVNATQTAKKLGKRTLMINYNPETVSTDYDICDRLYFEELTLERVLDIYEFEKPEGLIVAMGGQIPNNLALELEQNKVKILGTSASDIDRAENRHKFSALLDKLGVDQPAWKELTSLKAALAFASVVGFPVLVRPSYVLSGAAMNIATDEDNLKVSLTHASRISPQHPVVISKFISGAKEIEIDGVAQRGKLKIYAVSEHIENAGVHSGDATMVLPPQKTYLETLRRIREISKRIVRVLNITGPFNIQFIAKDNQIKVIECNLRSSRSFPFVSKVTKYNFIELATQAILGQNISEYYQTLDLNYVGVKSPQFSYSRLAGADPLLYVEMGSTGEVACFGDDLQEALLKAMIASGLRLPRKNILLSIGGEKNKMKLLEAVEILGELGFKIYATRGTSRFLANHGVGNIFLYKINERVKPNLGHYLEEGRLDFVINIPRTWGRQKMTDGYLMRRKAIDFNIPLLSDVQLANLVIKSLAKKKFKDLKVKSWREYK